MHPTADRRLCCCCCCCAAAMEGIAACASCLLSRGLFSCGPTVLEHDHDAWVQRHCSVGRMMCPQLPLASQYVTALAIAELSTTETIAARVSCLLSRGLFSCGPTVLEHDYDACLQRHCSVGCMLVHSCYWIRCCCGDAKSRLTQPGLARAISMHGRVWCSLVSVVSAVLSICRIRWHARKPDWLHRNAFAFYFTTTTPPARRRCCCCCCWVHGAGDMVSFRDLIGCIGLLPSAATRNTTFVASMYERSGAVTRALSWQLFVWNTQGMPARPGPDWCIEVLLALLFPERRPRCCCCCC